MEFKWKIGFGLEHKNMWLKKFITKELNHYTEIKGEALEVGTKKANQLLKVLGKGFFKERVKK